MTKSLGRLVSAKDQQPEVFVWKDASDSVVTLTFLVGKLQSWELVRPAPEPDPDPLPGATTGPANP